MSSNPQLEQLLSKIFDEFQDVEDPAVHAKNREEFVFHMTDWAEDLEQLATLYRQPEKWQKQKSKASQVVAGFLYHAFPHLKAAGRLLVDEIPDAFDESQPKLNIPMVAPQPRLDVEEENKSARR
jgi:hypothetical protein